MIYKTIQQLGKKIDSDWKQSDYDLNFFPEIAYQNLFESQIESPDIAQLNNALYSHYENLPQLDLDDSFGEPPVTLYKSGHFAIDLYFWFSTNTAIHSHGFRGAFKILKGSALQASYKINIDNQSDAQKAIFFQKPDSINIKVIKENEVQRILPGPDFVHSIGHCDQPQITICVRTFDEKLYQHNYLGPDIFYVQAEMMHFKYHKTLRLIEACHKMNGEKAAFELYGDWLKKVDDETLLAHYIRPQNFTKKSWSNLRIKEMRLRNWGERFLSAHEKNDLNVINFSTLLTPAHRAIAFLLQHGTSPLDFENDLRQSFGLKGELRENIENIFLLLIEKKAIAKVFNSTALDSFRYMLQGLSNEQIVQKICEDYSGVSHDEVTKDLKVMTDELATIPLYQTAIACCGSYELG